MTTQRLNMSQSSVIHVLIDTGCLQTNIINTRVVDLLNEDGGTLYKTDIMRVLTKTDQMIEYIRMTPGQPDEDFTTGGSALQQRIRALLTNYFSFNVKGKAVSVSPIEFTVDATRWEAPATRLPSRHISVEKHAALNKMIDDLLDL